LAKKIGRRKHIPQRTCVVCRLKIDKRRLTRIVRTKDSGVVIDPTGKLNGRGAYLCDNTDCWNEALKSQVLDRALQTEVAAEDKMALTSSMPGSPSRA
jgi:predicted RNA-binding protein YlxR (DUF448 family)